MSNYYFKLAESRLNEIGLGTLGGIALGVGAVKGYNYLKPKISAYMKKAGQTPFSQDIAKPIAGAVARSAKAGWKKIGGWQGIKSGIGKAATATGAAVQKGLESMKKKQEPATQEENYLNYREGLRTLFEAVLLEDDRNRGAPGRSVPKLGHFPSDEEIRRGLKSHPELGKVNPVTGRTPMQGKRSERYKSLSREGQNLMSAFTAGRGGYRWQGTGNTVPKEVWDQQTAAHEAGKAAYGHDPKQTHVTAMDPFEVEDKIGKPLPPNAQKLRNIQLQKRAMNAGNALLVRMRAQRHRLSR